MKAAIYARVSRPDESEAGGGDPILENQIRDLRELAARHAYGLTEDHVYVEVASGSDDGRNALGTLLHDASLAHRPFDVVLFRSLSRVTRNGMEGALEILRKLKEAGVGWRFLDTPILDSAEDTNPLVRDVMLAIITGVDRDYRDRISKSTRAAYERRKNRADQLGEKVRWGRHRKDCNCERCVARRAALERPAGGEAAS